MSFEHGRLIVLSASLALWCDPLAAQTMTWRLPPRIEHDAPLAQIFDYRIADKGALSGGRRVLVWGAAKPDIAPDVYTTYYYPLNRDMDRKRDVAWYKQHAPDWIAYKCDRATPAHLYKYDWGAYTPLDISSSAVRAYFMNAFLQPALARGYPAVGIDNVSLVNFSGQCGVWREGAWVSQYGGQVRDLAYARAVIDYLKYLRAELHRRGAALAVNFTFDPRQAALSEKLLDEVDIWVSESGFFSGCRGRAGGEDWRIRAAAIAKFARRKPFVSINQLCGEGEPSAGDMEWIAANFLLLRGPWTYLSVSGLQQYGVLLDVKPLSAPVGRPLRDMVEHAGLFSRDYEKAIVVVNPSPDKSAALPLPSGRFTTTEGVVLQSRVEVPPLNGYVLYRK